MTNLTCHRAMSTHFQVIVGNIGTVYSGPDRIRAIREYGEYVDLSQRGVGRAAGEAVTLLKNDTIIVEHIPETPDDTDCGVTP